MLTVVLICVSCGSVTWSTLPQSSCPSERLLWKNFQFPSSALSKFGWSFATVSSLSVLDINPLLRRMVCTSSFPVRGLPSPLRMASLLGALGAILVLTFALFLLWMLWRSLSGPQPPSLQGLPLLRTSLRSRAGLRLHACPLPSKQPGRGALLPTVGFLPSCGSHTGYM